MPERSSKTHFDLGSLPDPKFFECENKTHEIPEVRTARLRNEFLAFLFRDLSVYVVAVLIVLVALVSCFVVLVVRDSTLQAKNWAISVLSSIFTGAVGFAFGKSASK